MNLIVTERYSGYLLSEIEAELQFDMPRFLRWLAGQTCILHEGQVLVWLHDWEWWTAWRSEHPLAWD